MPFTSLFRPALLSALLLLSAAASQAQVPDTAAASTTQPSQWLLKSGLRLTHLSYNRSSTSWRLLVPVSLAVERRFHSRFSLYAQLEPDMQLTSISTARRRRRSAVGADAALFSTAVGLGGRCYYGRPAGALARSAAVPEFGKYVAVELGADVAQAATITSAFVGNRSVLTPSCFVFWGIQNRLRPHALYDLSAGLGLLAPARTDAEYPLASHRWDVGAQVNIRLYWVN